MVIDEDATQRWIQGLVIATLSFGSWLTGSIPGVNLTAHTVTLQFGTAVQAQVNPSFTSEEITNYARAAIALEARRYQVVNEIKKIVGEVPHIVCDEPQTIQRLPGNIPQIAVNYCDQARQIIERQNLTVTRFNQITRQQQADPQFREQIQAEILRVLQSTQPQQ